MSAHSAHPAHSALIHIYNGIPFTTRSSSDLLNSLNTFQAREDDLLLVSYPKSGTHWLAEIMKHLYPCKVALTSPIEFGDTAKLEELKNITSKRIIPTHLNYEMIPTDFKVKKSKAIYIIRNPKDTAVSLFHYYKDNPNLPTIETWQMYFEMFLQGQVVCGPWFDHILGWEEHRNEMPTLFLYYEAMKKDLPKSIRKISTFLGINVNDDEINEICNKTSFSEMKTNVEKENTDPKHTVCSLTSNKKLIFRKGTVGDWKFYFTPKQNRLFDELYNSKMNSSYLAKQIQYETENVV
ncbi:sulfotransferase 6B1-like [Bombina bombina]|uniref:sulfotransferase 6B1-like n=1 Tax=Bombina bombina TaxID=8345 RepID=UPI00235A7DEC|nr:sulfotransferase 6B1-like [Bombina bombina]